MNKKIGWGIAVIVVVALIVLASTTNRKEKKVGVLNVGVISALTGQVAYIGNSNMKGTEVGKIKAEIEHPGLTMNLLQEDHQFSPPTGISAYNKLRQSSNINALVTMASNVSVAIAPLALKDNVLTIAASTLANAYSTPNDLTFRLTANGDIEAPPTVEYLTANSLKKLGIIYMQNEIGVTMRDSLKKVASGTPVTIVAEEGYSPDTKDFRTIILKMKVAGVDSIYLAALANHSAMILPQANELGLKVPFISYRAYEDPVILKIGKLAENVIYPSTYDSENSNPENVVFVKLYKEKYNEMPNVYAAEAYEATRLIADTFVKCGNTVESQEARTCSISYLTTLKDKPTVFGPINFDKNGDVSYPFFMKTVKDGEFVKVK